MRWLARAICAPTTTTTSPCREAWKVADVTSLSGSSRALQQKSRCTDSCLVAQGTSTATCRQTLSFFCLGLISADGPTRGLISGCVSRSEARHCGTPLSSSGSVLCSLSHKSRSVAGNYRKFKPGHSAASACNEITPFHQNHIVKLFFFYVQPLRNKQNSTGRRKKNIFGTTFLVLDES